MSLVHLNQVQVGLVKLLYKQDRRWNAERRSATLDP